MYFGIYDEFRVRNLSLRGKKAILIRIFAPNSCLKERYSISNLSDYEAILELDIFDYVKEPNGNELEDVFTKLNNFILDNDFDEVVVHCSLGMSRSPAIMLCIARILKNTELENIIKEKFKFYNRFIVKEFENYSFTIKEIKDKEVIIDYPLKKNKSLTLSKRKIIVNDE